MAKDKLALVRNKTIRIIKPNKPRHNAKNIAQKRRSWKHKKETLTSIQNVK